MRQLQEQLDAIASVYTAIPRVAADGFYGPATAAAVSEFQSIFGLPQTGVVDFRTWYKISHIYVGITRIAELTQYSCYNTAAFFTITVLYPYSRSFFSMATA